ncbi:hypothetical protein EJB05_51773, partial [Eragrostis curvula]
MLTSMSLASVQTNANFHAVAATLLRLLGLKADQNEVAHGAGATRDAELEQGREPAPSGGRRAARLLERDASNDRQHFFFLRLPDAVAAADEPGAAGLARRRAAAADPAAGAAGDDGGGRGGGVSPENPLVRGICTPTISSSSLRT